MLLAEKVLALADAQKRKGEMLSLRAEKREARDRLKLYGMSDEQIRLLDRDDATPRNTETIRVLNDSCFVY
jgi:cobalt-zinc-cadmium efflux system membrane fusion protein